jgi:hypothetical protein
VGDEERGRESKGMLPEIERSETEASGRSGEAVRASPSKEERKSEGDEEKREE